MKPLPGGNLPQLLVLKMQSTRRRFTWKLRCWRAPPVISQDITPKMFVIIAAYKLDCRHYCVGFFFYSAYLDAHAHNKYKNNSTWSFTKNQRFANPTLPSTFTGFMCRISLSTGENPWPVMKNHGLWNSTQQLLLNNWQKWSFRDIKSIGNLKYTTRLKRGGSCSNTRCPFITLRTKLYLYYLTAYLNTTLHYLAKHTLFFCDKTPRAELTLHFHQTLNTFTEAHYRHHR